MTEDRQDQSAVERRILQAEERRRRRRQLIFMALCIVAAGALTIVGAFDADRWVRAGGNLGVILNEMIPPDFSRWRDWLQAIADTIAMSVAATALAVAVAIPLGLVASERSGTNSAIAGVIRTGFAVLRSVPDIGLGLILVIAVGPGPLAGTLALTLYSVGMLGKFAAEAMDHVDPDMVELGRSLQLRRSVTTVRICLPGLLPRLADYALYRWEHNVRASAVLGLVGAGGIGFELISAFRVFAYDEVLAILMLIVALVLVVESIGLLVRRSFR